MRFLSLVAALTLTACQCGTNTMRTFPQISVSPRVVNWGTVREATPVQRSVTVVNGGNALLTVSRVTITGESARFFNATTQTLTIEPGLNQLLFVTYTPSELGTHNALLTLESDAANAPELSLSLAGIREDPPCVCNLPPNTLCYQPLGVCADAGCTYTRLSDGTACVNGECQQGTCVPRDAGVDAGVDAGTDAGMDAGCARRWGTPVPVAGANINSSAEEAHPTMSGDGLRLCFTSNRAGTADIWCATRTTTTDPWSAPVAQVNVNGSATEWMADLSADGLELVFSSDRAGGAGAFDLYVSQFVAGAGAFGTPQPLTALNTAAWETGPHFARDGLTLYFDSNRADGGTSIYVASRAMRGLPFTGPTQALFASGDLGTKQEPAVCDDLMVFCSDRPDAGLLPGRTFQLWTATRGMNGWTDQGRADVQWPVEWGGCGPSLSPQGELLFHSGPDAGAGASDLFIAPRN